MVSRYLPTMCILKDPVAVDRSLVLRSIDFANSLYGPIGNQHLRENQYHPLYLIYNMIHCYKIQEPNRSFSFSEIPETHVSNFSQGRIYLSSVFRAINKCTTALHKHTQIHSYVITYINTYIFR